MIVELFLAPIILLIQGLLLLIPAFTIPADIGGGITFFFTLITPAGYFLPLSTIATVLIVFLSWYAFKLLWSVINWVIKKIPTIS